MTKYKIPLLLVQYFFITITVIYSIVFLTVDTFGNPLLKESLKQILLAPQLHVTAGIIALIIGPFQFSERIRHKSSELHRILGRIYILCIILSGAAGLVLAIKTPFGIIASLGFSGLAISWVFTVIIALIYIRKGKLQKHKKWITANYSLTLAAVMLRVYLPLSLFAKIPFELAYPVISWLCWVPNILFALYFSSPATRRSKLAID